MSPRALVLLPLPLLLACAGGDDLHSPVKADTGEDGADGGVGDGGGGDDGGGTDEDGDGFSVEEGDCDDTDFRVNPAWPEERWAGR